jgi:hypothetical protein
MYREFEPNRVRSLVGWDILENRGGPVVAAVKVVRDHHLLPESYVYGFAHTYRFSLYRKSFLNGEYRSDGWIQFFPYTTLVKTPLALFGLIALAALAALAALSWARSLSSWRARAYEWSPLLALFLVYWAFSLSSGLNIGHRHIMPVYPVLFVMASGAGAWVGARTRWKAVLVGALVAWFAAESIWIRPSYLEYFNEIVGPADAWHHLVDSSIDWGQDLPALRTWLDKNPTKEPIYISYFGSGDLETYGIHATRIGDANFDLRPRRAPTPLGGGLWIISVTQFQQVYTEARGPWDREKEQHYQALLRHLIELQRTHGHMDYHEGVAFENFQFARLCHTLVGRPPDARPSYTFLVYRLTDEQVQSALYGPVPLP